MKIDMLKKTIESEVVAEMEFQKSKFITYLFPIHSEDEAKDAIREVKKLHPKATHHCVAYITGEIERSNDDGEPASSAGLPMLQVLRGWDLDGVLAVVVRYFGGTLLGVGGLIRAYGKSVSNALEVSIILSQNRVYYVSLRFAYDAINAVETYLNEHADIINRDYSSVVQYDVRTLDPLYLDGLIDETRGTIEINIEKETIELAKES